MTASTVSTSNRLDDLFARKRENILNIYFTAGYPTLDATETIITELAAAGADLIEVGMPFSDPMADGETIQRSSMRALENGMSLDLLFEQIGRARATTQVPLVLMGYLNQVMQYGEERFVAACRTAGVDGLILPDLPAFEYRQHYGPIIEAADLRTSFLITPNTSEERIRQLAELSKGFIYVVSSSSITGKSGKISLEQIAYFQRIQALQLPNPTLIGFGISDAESFRTACQYANGAIIGSAFIRALSGSISTSEVAKVCHEFVTSIRSTPT